jgi:hypothetical protein
MKLGKKQDKEPDIFDKAEIDDLRAGMSRFDTKRHLGRLLSSYEQFLASEGIISFNHYCRWIVHDPSRLTKTEKVKAMIDSYDYRKLMELYANFPEKKKEDDAKIRKIRDEFRAKMQTWKIQTSPET